MALTWRSRRHTRWIRNARWSEVTLPDAVEHHPSMLSRDEKAALYELARRADVRGRIVDAGCFLGGSTVAFAAGVAAHPRPKGSEGAVVSAFDLFEVDPWSRSAYAEQLGDFEVGASFRSRFDELVGDHAAGVEVVEGDILDAVWDGGPIALLFIDVCKSWEINDHVMRQFFGSLVPHRSVVVHQDFIHEWLPHIHVGMGLLADAFELVSVAEPCSAIYVPTRTIRADELPPALADVPDDVKLDAFDRACAPFGEAHRRFLVCPRATLLAQMDRHDEALACLDGAEDSQDERLRGAAAATGAWVRRVHPDPAVSGPAWDELERAQAET